MPSWTKHEVIDAVVAEYRPSDLDDTDTWAVPVCLRAFMRLALGKPEGRAPPHVEHELWRRLCRVHRALHDGRDPSAAYDVPLGDDDVPLTADMPWISRGRREVLELFERLDRELRTARRR